MDLAALFYCWVTDVGITSEIFAMADDDGIVACSFVVDDTRYRSVCNGADCRANGRAEVNTIVFVLDQCPRNGMCTKSTD